METDAEVKAMEGKQGTEPVMEFQGTIYKLDEWETAFAHSSARIQKIALKTARKATVHFTWKIDYTRTAGFCETFAYKADAEIRLDDTGEVIRQERVWY